MLCNVIVDLACGTQLDIKGVAHLYVQLTTEKHQDSFERRKVLWERSSMCAKEVRARSSEKTEARANSIFTKKMTTPTAPNTYPSGLDQYASIDPCGAGGKDTVHDTTRYIRSLDHYGIFRHSPRKGFG